MTNREAVIAEVQVPISSDQLIDKALIDAALDANSAYTADNFQKVAQAAVKVLRPLLGTKSITEGGFSISLQVQERLAVLEPEAGIIVTVGVPTVRSRNVW